MLGTVEGARIPECNNQAMRCIEYSDYSEKLLLKQKQGLYPQHVLEETYEDLENFKTLLESRNIEVIRPSAIDLKEIYNEGGVQVDGYYSYCPRDNAFVYGNKMMVAPMPLPHRHREHRGFIQRVKNSNIIRLDEYIYDDRNYVLTDKDDNTSINLNEMVPLFDAANIVRNNNEFVYLVSNTGNILGAEWVKRSLPSDIEFHIIDGELTAA